MRRTSSGVFALLVIGGFVAWRNRFKIQRFLEAQGFDLPLSTSNLSDTFQSGVAKVAGSVDRVRNELEFEEEHVRKAV